MARTTNSLDNSEGSHFSGRPPPPYQLFDVRQDPYTRLLTAARKQLSGADEKPAELSEGKTPRTERESASNEFDRSLIQLVDEVYIQKVHTSTVSDSEDGGCRLPPSSKGESWQTYSGTVVTPEVADAAHKSEVLFRQSYSDLPEAEVDGMWWQLWVELISTSLFDVGLRALAGAHVHKGRRLPDKS